MATSDSAKAEPSGQQTGLNAKIWGISVRQIVYMALGAALYGGLSYLTNIIKLPATSNVSIRPAVVIPLLFGSVFGPWVGLFTGFVGNIIGDFLSGFGGPYWNWDLGNGLIGFLPGLAIYLTWARYRSVRSIVVAEIFSLVGIVVGMAFAAYTDMPLLKYTFGAATGNFVPAVIPDLINGLILLPILLVAYTAAVRRTGRG